MMKRFYFFFPVMALLTLLSPSATADADAAKSLEQQANEKMQEILTEQRAIGLSVAVVKEGKLVYTSGFGYKNLEDRTLVSPEDIFRIASVSKSITTTAIMQLFERGKFKLDDDVSDALGITVRNPNFPDTPITYRMLLTHTSSLNDAMGYFSFNTIDRSVNDDFGKAYNKYAPGTTYQYCNMGYNMLGALVEIHSGERFDTYVENHILKPIGMVGSFNADTLDASRFVTLYTYRDGNPVASRGVYGSPAAGLENYVKGRNTFLFSPTGGMKTAPKYLARHMMVQMNGGTVDGVQVLKPESVATMQTPLREDVQYGFATRTVNNLVEGVTLKGHTGSAYGLFSAMFFCPEKKFGFIMMTNGYPEKKSANDFLTIQTDVINALYDIFIKE